MSCIDKNVLDTLRELLGDDLLGITEVYAQQLPADIQAIQDGHACGDLPRLKLLAHALKGSSANLGAQEVSSLAAQIEKNAQAGNAQAIIEPLAALPQAGERALEAMRAQGYLAAAE